MLLYMICEPKPDSSSIDVVRDNTLSGVDFVCRNTVVVVNSEHEKTANGWGLLAGVCPEGALF